MALKRYSRKYVKTYIYHDPESGEDDEITFIANGYLFPLFKSLSGVELSDALNEYRTGLLNVVDEASIEAMFKIEQAQSADEKLEILKDNSVQLLNLLKAANSVSVSGEPGLDLIELVMICTRICALPEDERSEALGYGTELLPKELCEDPSLALELIAMAINYDGYVKKNAQAVQIMGRATKS